MGAKGKSYDFLENIRAPKRGGATARVVEALREAIVMHCFRAGRLSTRPSSAKGSVFRVSRCRRPWPGSRREGLVDIQPQRGTIVSLIRFSDARENMFLRRALEVEAVRSLAATSTTTR